MESEQALPDILPSTNDAAKLENDKKVLAHQVLFLRNKLMEVQVQAKVDGGLQSVPEDTPAQLGMIEFEAVQIGDDEHSLITFDTSSTMDTPPVRLARRIAMSKTKSLSNITKAEPKTIAPQSPPENQFEPPLGKRSSNNSSGAWTSLAFLCTFIVPDAFIRKQGPSAKQAWREKVTICMIVLVLSATVVGGLGFVPVVLCRSPTESESEHALWKQPETAVTGIFGRLYDTSDFATQHPGGMIAVTDYWGHDASDIFPRVPAGRLPLFCVDTAKVNYLAAHSVPTCPNKPFVEACHTSLVGREAIHSRFAIHRKGDVTMSVEALSQSNMLWVQIGSSIYNVTEYVEGLRDGQTNEVVSDPKHPNAYLYRSLHDLILTRLNQDATELYNDMFDSIIMQEKCLDELFYIARIEEVEDSFCPSSGPWVYVLLFLVTGMAAIQALVSLAYAYRRRGDGTTDELQSGVLIMVPCFDENEYELRRTFDSCLQTSYPGHRRVLVVVADGEVKGTGEAKSTPEIVADILGLETNYDTDDDCLYTSIGSYTENIASVYTGTYQNETEDGGQRSLNYIVVIKRGVEEEQRTCRAGSRGKRDSELIISGMFNRIHHNREPTALDLELAKALFGFSLPVKNIQYFMAVEPSTWLDTESISHMVQNMEFNKQTLACSGEMLVDNKTESVVTVMQVFEYYSRQLIGKGFESVVGCVTSLPAGCIMYRVFSEDMKSLVGNDYLYQEYSRNDARSLHEKTLLDIGEHNMLATLMLQRFPQMNLSFVSEATCGVIVPSTLSTLLRQRRRWFSSEFHNAFELLKVETSCNVCCSPMKMIVIMSLIARAIMPAVLIYLAYLVFLFIAHGESFDMLPFPILGFTVVMQMLSFLDRSRWEYLAWYPIYVILGVPFFHFVLPIYAFFNMDGFTDAGRQRAALRKAPLSSRNFPAETEDSSSGEEPGAGELPSTTSVSNHNATQGLGETMYL